MMRIREAIVVEGKYDRIRLAGLVDTVIVETGGFRLFQDGEKLSYLRALAREHGLIVLTDSDGAGFLIRGKLSSCIPKEQLKHAYIPDVPGKERRKDRPSREGTLGVEGMDTQTLLDALRRAGATPIEADGGETGPAAGLSKADLYAAGLSGRPDSAARRRALQRRLGLPEKLSANGLLDALNALYGKDAPAVLERETKEEDHG